jgi:hypothetical protein
VIADAAASRSGFLQFHYVERAAKCNRQDESSTQTEQAVKGLPVKEIVEYLNEEAQCDQNQADFANAGANRIAAASIRGHRHLLI